MAVSYGKEYMKQPIGILKIVEIVLLIVVMILTMCGRSGTMFHDNSMSPEEMANHYDRYHNNYYSDNAYYSVYPPCIVSIIVSLLILIFSLWQAVGEAMDCVLKFAFILLILLGVWLVVVMVWVVMYACVTMVMIAAIVGIVAGVVYLVDAFFSIKAYNVC